MPDTVTARAVVVDDNPATLYSTSRVLRAAHFDVSEGINGGQALELAFKGTDILLLDVNLPDIHGFEVVRRLRRDPRTARLPVIHISATFVNERDKAQGLDAGGDGYLTHPIEPPVLVATVNAFLRARRAEEETRKSEAKFRAVFDNAFSGIMLLDQDLTALEVNPAICSLLQRSSQEIIGKSLSFFMPPGISASPQEIERELEKQNVWRGTFPLLRADGELVHLEWYISVHSFPGVRLAVVTDITERVKSEAERAELLTKERIARAEAERANRLKDDFLGTLSHELRTPLNSMLLWVQLVRQQIDNREQLIRGLAAIERGIGVQTQLISDLLDVSRIISGKLQLDVRPLDLAATIKAALESLWPAIETKRLMLQTSIDETARLVTGDPARLQQVISNLLSNAIKFTPKGGQIHVTLKRVGSRVQIQISDTGQGIEPELLPHIFERFRQGDSGSNRIHGGLGLGLAIVKHLVELHGGTVAASSAGLGEGATFSILLPILAFENSPFLPAKGDGGQKGRNAHLDGTRILLVDDDVDARAAMSRILEQNGAMVVTAADVDSAIAELERFGPQVLVSDIAMPERDGFELIREVRARGYSYQALPAIALTAFARPEDRSRVLLAGYQAYATKPINATELTAAVAALIGRFDADA
ncbi:MAG: response regulator [Deltaproteobacteria bacterium]|nr:response regulator [Deltaproteobacteria bacterium]